jgi:hypothetical protein
VDEFLDFWQSTLNPTAMSLVQNTLMYKLFFKYKEPDAKVGRTVLGGDRSPGQAIEAAVTLHLRHKLIVHDYFLVVLGSSLR